MRLLYAKNIFWVFSPHKPATSKEKRFNANNNEKKNPSTKINRKLRAAAASAIRRPMSTARRDYLIDMEQKAQKKWADLKCYEANVPADPSTQEKYMITFPYPYMNGKLHLGHGFSATKSEFAARFMRLQGKNVLWPFGLHVTGTPIAACALKLRNEMEKYGNPPRFPEEVLNPDAPKAEQEQVPGKHKAKRGKVGPAKPQWLIMRGMGIPDEDIAKFADPMHWLGYFPPMALDDIRRFGCHIDYRRSFITTKVNPVYDSFIRWQFRKLRSKNLLEFGKRPCVYSEVDGQPCADHDRASGEGVQPLEYTVVKLVVQNVETHEAFKPHLSIIGDKEVVLPGATLRAETVVGQTNCWMSPEITYKAFEITAPECKPQIFVMTQKAARNMAFQDILVNGKANYTPTPLFEVPGNLMVGIPLTAPHAPYKTIYTLPMFTITENKGTGVVMSVPSDSPDDYINLATLVNKPDYRVKLGLKDEWILPMPVVAILNIPGEYGQDSAKIVIQNLKINSPKETERLDEAKKLVYQAGYYHGIMIRGPFEGQKVCDAKVNMAQLMYKNGEAVRYLEPQSQVISRSNDECVVAICDQWYIRYGDAKWKEAVQAHLKERLECYFPGIYNAFDETLNWLGEWPCSRNFGLGTELPFKDSAKVMIDSLSDSTIYMAYYTISHYVHAAEDGSLNLDGTKPNKYGLKPSMFEGDKPWDYIMRGEGTPEEIESATGLPKDIAKKLRGEFLYWYPVDLRVSAKDLIQNHLTMFLYNHAAIWNDDSSKWPRSIFCNGHILVNNEKMSKNKGNFIMLREAIDKYGADPTRLAMADAGDSLDDANFVVETAEGFILKLTAFIDMAKDSVKNKGTLRKGDLKLFDRIFDNAINFAIEQTTMHYGRMSFRMALNSIFFEFQNAYSQYKIACGDSSVHADLLLRYIEVTSVLIMPLAPHFAEHVWSDVLGREGTVMDQRIPKQTAPVKFAMQMAATMIDDVLKDVRAQAVKLAKKNGAIEEAHIYVANEYLAWQQSGLKALRAIYDENNQTFPKDTVKQIQQQKADWMKQGDMQSIMSFIAFCRANCERYGAEAIGPKPIVNDQEVLTEAMSYMLTSSNIKKIVIRLNTDESTAQHARVRATARPGQPACAFVFAPKK